MEPFEIFAQAISIVAMAIGVLSFQQKTQKGIVLMQFCSSILFAIHYGMIGGLIACMLNSIGIVRAAVFSQRDKRAWAAHISWVYVFSAAFIAIYILMFTALRTVAFPNGEVTAFDYIVQILPVIGMIATTVSFRAKNAASVRALSFISSPAWLIYNIITFSIGGILTEAFVMCSIIIGILRLDRKKKVTNTVEADE